MRSKKVNNPQLKLGAIILSVVLLPVLSCFLLGHLDTGIDMDQRLLPGSDRFPLGTDDLGRDLLSSLVAGTGNSLTIGFLVVLLSSSIGTVLGLVSGFAGGWVDALVMRLVDVILGFPGILLAIALMSALDAGFFWLVGVLAFSGWVGYARIIRGEVVKYKNLEFVLAARSYNASRSRIVFIHLAPLILPLVVVQAFMDMGAVILVESSLNFLGIGLAPEVPSLGQLIDAGRWHLFDRPGLLLLPGGVLFLVVLGFNALGEGLRSLLSR